MPGGGGAEGGGGEGNTIGDGGEGAASVDALNVSERVVLCVLVPTIYFLKLYSFMDMRSMAAVIHLIEKLFGWVMEYLIYATVLFLLPLYLLHLIIQHLLFCSITNVKHKSLIIWFP